MFTPLEPQPFKMHQSFTSTTIMLEKQRYLPLPLLRTTRGKVNIETIWDSSMLSPLQIFELNQNNSMAWLAVYGIGIGKSGFHPKSGPLTAPKPELLQKYGYVLS